MLASLKNLVKEFLRTAFDIRVGEYKRVLLMQLNIFLIILILLIIKPVVNGKFLSIIGVEQLPVVFVLVAVFAMIITTLYSRALSKRSLQKTISNTRYISISSLIIIGIALHFRFFEKWVLYIFYIGVAIFGLLTTSQFWILANLTFNPREAKRLFSFIGAGAIAGGIAGGYLTTLLAPVINGINLLFVAAALLAVCIYVNRIIWKKHVPVLNTVQHRKRMTGIAEHPFRTIRNSRHLSYLALIIGVSVLVAKLVDFQFSAMASAAISDSDNLTAFFGFWFSTFNVVSLLIQLFLTRKIVGVYGVGSSLFVLPGGIFLGALAILFAPVLWAGVFIKLFDVTLKQSINKSATELLALPIPQHIKSQTKSFIDVFVDTAATGASGLILIFLVHGFDLSVRSISVLIILLIGGWTYYAMKVRKEYVKSFKTSIADVDKEIEKNEIDFTNESVIQGLKKALDHGTVNQILFVLSKINEIQDNRLLSSVRPLLKHVSPEVRSQALQCLYFLDDKSIIDQVIPLLKDTDYEVRFHAFECILRHSAENRVQVINSYLQHEDPMVNGAALVGLAAEARTNPEMKRLFKLEQRIHEKIDYLNILETAEEIKQYKIMILRAIGNGMVHKYYPIIEAYLDDPDPDIVKKALRAAGDSYHTGFIPKIVRFLVPKEYRVSAQSALIVYGKGLPEPLDDLVRNRAVETEVIRFLPSVVETIECHESVEFLLSLIHYPDVAVKLDALRSLNKMKTQFPHLHIRGKGIIELIIDEAHLYRDTLVLMYAQITAEYDASIPVNEGIKDARNGLIHLLERRLDGTLERIFRLLGLRYPPDEIWPVYQGIRNKSPDIRINAVEFLENILDLDLKRVLIPIVETAMLEQLTEEAIERLKLEIPDDQSCFQSLLEGKDTKIKLAVLHLIGELGQRDFIPMVENCIGSGNSKVQTFAGQALRKLRARE